MPLIDGIFNPGSAHVVETAITTDSDAFIAAGAGRRLVAAQVRLTSGQTNANGNFIKGATVAAAGICASFTLLTAIKEVQVWDNFGPSGMDISGGLTIDHVSGTFEAIAHWITVK